LFKEEELRMNDILLQMRNITKEFSGVKALNNVNLQVERGSIHGIVGENGAGKSTLMNIISGVYPYGSYTGEIVYNGQACRFSGIRDSEKKGIVIIHQELALVPQFSIAENIFLGNEVTKVKGIINWDLTNSQAQKYMDRVHLKESSRSLVRDISVGKMQLVEIAKAISKNVKLLILDEPTAALNDEDSQNLLDLLVSFKRDGMTCILITHKLAEIEQVADYITIIRDGSVIDNLTAGVSDMSESRIVKDMVGREMTDRYPERDHNIGKVKFEIKNWTAWHPLYDRKVVDNVSMNVRKGEVVGISGLMGAGRSELAMSVFGRLYGRNISGKLLLDGKEVVLKTVNDAVAHKVAYVTEDRKTSGLIWSDSIRWNISLANLKAVSKMGMINLDQETVITEEYRKRYGVKSDGVNQKVESLSGGNQQKVLLSKWMFTEPEVLILDEPTRGIDVGAKYEIYQFINNMVEQGRSVIMISSEMQEILGMCDRIYVLYDGKIIAEMPREKATQEVIMTCILHSAAGEMRVSEVGV
jgi:putative multiple sugar transport system ATP-binding protein